MAGVNRARSSGKQNTTPTEAKTKVLALLQDGFSVRDAMVSVGRKESTYIEWRRTDPVFKAKVDDMRALAKAARDRGLGAGPGEGDVARQHLVHEAA